MLTPNLRDCGAWARRWRLSTRSAQVIDDSLVNRLAHLGARIHRDLVDTEHAAFGT